jgi:hypothetical protein
VGSFVTIFLGPVVVVNEEGDQEEEDDDDGDDEVLLFPAILCHCWFLVWTLDKYRLGPDVDRGIDIDVSRFRNCDDGDFHAAIVPLFLLFIDEDDVVEGYCCVSPSMTSFPAKCVCIQKSRCCR